MKEPGGVKFSQSIENYYESVKRKIAPLYDAWLLGALVLPGQYCLQYLNPEGGAGENIIFMEEQLAHLDKLSYLVLMDIDSVNNTLISETAKRVKEKLHETGCTFKLPR